MYEVSILFMCPTTWGLLKPAPALLDPSHAVTNRSDNVAITNTYTRSFSKLIFQKIWSKNRGWSFENSKLYAKCKEVFRTKNWPSLYEARNKIKFIYFRQQRIQFISTQIIQLILLLIQKSNVDMLLRNSVSSTDTKYPFIFVLVVSRKSVK